MGTGEAAVHVERSPHDVFAVLSDVGQNPRWSSSAIESRVTSLGPVGVGSTAHEVSRFLGRRIEVDTEVVAFEPDRLLGVLVTGGPFPLNATFRLDPVDDGCQVTVTFEARPGRALRVVDRAFAMIAGRKFATDLANLKRLLEQHDPADGPSRSEG